MYWVLRRPTTLMTRVYLPVGDASGCDLVHSDPIESGVQDQNCEGIKQFSAIFRPRAARRARHHRQVKEQAFSGERDITSKTYIGEDPGQDTDLASLNPRCGSPDSWKRASRATVSEFSGR